MGRAVRVLGAGASCHVVARGNNRQMMFLDDQDRERFLELLVEVAGVAGWRGLAYCLMGNHLHLVVTTPEGDLPQVMRDVLGRYARWFNRTRRRSGHVFGGRYRSGLIESDAHLLAVVRYVARNPYAAGLVSDPVDWEWGSYRAVVLGLPGVGFVDHDEVLGLFHRHEWRARLALRQFVMSGLVAAPRRQEVLLDVNDVSGRPSVWKVFCALPPLEATLACSRLGYTHAEIAAGAGVTRSAVSYRLRALGGSPRVCLARRGERERPETTT